MTDNAQTEIDEGLDLESAADEIRGKLMQGEPPAPPEPEPQPAVEDPEPVPAQQSDHATLAHYQQQLNAEAAAIAQGRREAAELRHSDPAEYAAMSAELSNRENNLQRAHMELNQAATQQAQELLERETKKVAKLIPNWGEQTKKEIKAFLRRQGYTEKDWENLTDSRAVKMIYDAMQAEQSETRRAQRRKLPAIPKLRSKAAPKLDLERELRRRNAQPGGLDEAALKIQRMLAG